MCERVLRSQHLSRSHNKGIALLCKRTFGTNTLYSVIIMNVPSPEDKSYIDELKKSLYSRTVPDVQTRRKLRFDNESSDIKTSWDDINKKVVEPVNLEPKHSMSFFTKLFVGSAIFCIIAVGIGGYLFWNGSNLISADNIELSISGPVSISGGEPVTFDITAINKNKIDLELVDMSVDFPVGTTDPANSSQVLKNYRKLIGDMPVGKVVHESISATIFGEENLQKQIVVNLTYGVKGSTSTFTKSKTYDVLISSSPINFTVSSFKEVTSGQEFDMKVELTSNSQETLRNIMLKAVYPFGYNFISSSLTPLGDKSTWNIGDIPPGGKRAFTIRGSLSGEDNDLRAFHFNVGSQSLDNKNVIGTQYMAIEQDVTIQKPFITLNIDVDSDQGSKDHVGRLGQNSNVVIRWFNNLSTIVSNVKITAKISGSVYDKTTIVPSGGVFDSLTDTITWNQQTNPELASVGPGENGSVAFSVVPKSPKSAITSPSISISAGVSGNRTQETNVPLAVTSSVKRNIIVSSNATLSGRIVRTVGPFANSGPIPPKVDQMTTYTIIWSVSNTLNPINDVVVKATLPPYVKWQNSVSPSTEDVSYDQNTGLVTWNVGNVVANTVGSAIRKEVAFQIAFTPSITQAVTAPTLVNQATLSGVDSFTNAQLESNQDLLGTRFSTDPAYKQGNEMVAK